MIHTRDIADSLAAWFSELVDGAPTQEGQAFMLDPGDAGASSGIGRKATERLAARGFFVYGGRFSSST